MKARVVAVVAAVLMGLVALTGCGLDNCQQDCTVVDPGGYGYGGGYGGGYGPGVHIHLHYHSGYRSRR